MAIDYPASPTLGQIHNAGGSSWQWDGTKWKVYGVTAGSVITSDVGRNLIHNPLFNVKQRGAGPWTVSGYTADRWAPSVVSDTVSFTLATLSDADRASIGDETAFGCLFNNFTGNAAAGAYSYLMQPIENARRLAGKTVTVSFYANAGAALKLGVNLLQNFGTGGSPSAALWALATGASVSIPGTAWARYTATIAVPSISGKTIGTNDNSYTGLTFFYSSGATNNALAGNTGVQTGIINIWGVQLEIGSVATPLEKPDPRYDLANCQRFYETGSVYNCGYQVGGQVVVVWLNFAVPKRAVPTIAFSGASYSNGSAIAAYQTQANGVGVGWTATGTNVTWALAVFTASADL